MKSATKQKKPPAKPRPLTVRQERFCEFVAGGDSGTDAYLAAGWKVTREQARKNASKLATKGDIKQRIAAIRAAASNRAEFKKDDLVRWLAAAVTTPVGEIDQTSPLCQEVTEDQIGGGNRGKLRRGHAPQGNEVVMPDVLRRRVKTVGKIEAARLLAELLGWKEPEKQEVDWGAKTLDAIRQRAQEAATPLARRV